VNALVERSGQRAVGDDDVEALEAGGARQHVPVGRKQSVRIAAAIPDGNDDVAPGPGRRALDGRAPYLVLVDPAERPALRLELAKGRRQKTGLANQAFGASIGFRTRLEHPQRETFKGIDIATVAPERVVEAKDFGDQARPQTEGRLGARRGRAPAGDTEQHFAPRGVGNRPEPFDPLAKPLRQLAWRDEVRQDQGSVALHDAVFDGAQQMGRRRARRHDDQPIACRQRVAFTGERRERRAKAAGTGGSHEAGGTRGDHRRVGGSSSVRISDCVRSSMMSAAAAADEASRARPRSPADAAA
jgi:hypothetical protein